MLQAICISQLNMNESAEELSKRDMFNRIVSNGGVVKSQQINEKDLTITEKLTILQADFEANNELFLYKFGIYLNINDLKNFDLENESDSHYYLDKLKQSLDPTKIETRVKNRRYNYLQRILKKSSYFSDEEMKIRSPFIYQQYIEQYKTHEERLAEKENDLSQNTLSQFLLGTIDNKVYQARCKIEEEAAEVEEEDEDDEDDNELDDDKLIEEDSDFKKCKKKKFYCIYIYIFIYR